MNIKSEFLKKSIPWFPNFSFAMLLISLVFSGFLSLLIIGLGEGVWFKLVALVISMIVLLVWTYDTSVTEEKHRDKILKQGLTIMLLTILFLEIPLFFNSKTITETGITIIITNDTKDGERIPDNDNDSTNDKYIQLPYKLVTFYDSDTNINLGNRKIFKTNEEAMKLYDNIIGREVYIDYFPFFVYSEEFKYIRTKVKDANKASD